MLSKNAVTKEIDIQRQLGPDSSARPFLRLGGKVADKIMS